MRTMKQLALVALLALLGVTVDLSAAGTAGGSAEEILKQARQAIGGEDALRSVQSLTAKGKYRRVLQDRDVSGERELYFQLPDKFQRSDSFERGPMGMSVYMTRTLNGAQFWTDTSAPGGGVVIMRDGQPEKPTREQLEQMQRRQAAQLRAEFARYLLALFLNPPGDFNLTYTYAGEAAADDGHADVIDADGPEGFAARLFLSKETHLPLMLSYRGPRMRMMMMSRPGGGHGQPGGGAAPTAEAEKEARERLSKEGPPAKAEEAEYQLRFEDYRKVGALVLPHRITQAQDGEINEEWEIKSYEINPQFKADKFQKK
ncbi:MAG TPA: hypothetical protein VF544_17050 [Pyrinomonadaceae bacterium]